MAIAKIQGPMLETNLIRNGIDFAVETDLLYFDVGNGRIGIQQDTPTQALHVVGGTTVDNLSLTTNTISSLDTNGNIVLDPNGTGDLIFNADATISNTGPRLYIDDTDTGSNGGRWALSVDGLVFTMKSVEDASDTGAAFLQATRSSSTATTISHMTILAPQIQTAAGSASAPVIVPQFDTNTGMYFLGSDAMAFATGGTQRLLIEADGTLNVAGTTNYETLVLADDDIPNRKFVVDAVAAHVTNIIEDLTPQLGANLDVNDFDIVGKPAATVTSNGNDVVIAGGAAGTTSGTGGATYIDGGSSTTGTGGVLRLRGGAGVAGGPLQLYGGGDASHGGPIQLYANQIHLRNNGGFRSELFFFDADMTNQIVVRAPSTVTTNRTWELPQDDPATAAGGFLTTNASGTLSFVTHASSHTGQVTGSTALSLDITAITAQPASGAIAAADTIITNDGGVLSEATFTQMDTYFNSSLGFGDVFKVSTPVNNQVGVWTGDGTLEGDADLTFDGQNLTVGGQVNLTTANPSIEVLFTERADHNFVAAAGRGILWSRTGTPNDIIFTDEAATDFKLNNVVGVDFGDVFKVGTPVNNQIGVWTGDGTLEGESELTYDGSTLTVQGDILVSKAAASIALQGTTSNYLDYRTDATASGLDARIYHDAGGALRLTEYTADGVFFASRIELARSASSRIAMYTGGVNATSNAVLALELKADLQAEFQGQILSSASTTTRAGINIPEGVAPTSPNDGDIWVTAAGSCNARLNGVTVDLAAFAAGGVSKVGTPVDNQIGVWTGDGTLEGDANLTFVSNVLNIVGVVQTRASLTGGAGLNIPEGVAPTAPNDGDIWVTTTNALMRINGVSETISWASDLSSHTGDATIHFTEASIDHTAITNKGTNSHATIDSHIDSSATIHFTQGAISIPMSQISDVTATSTELNLLDLAGLTAGYVLSADTATTASWKAQSVTKVGTTVNNELGVWTGDGTLDSEPGLTYNGSTLTVSGDLDPNANNTRDQGTAGLRWATIYATTFNGTATTAQYADLAEKYEADAEYEVGTVLSFGGENEVTMSDEYLDHRVAGIVSAEPAYLMNSDMENGTVVALRGRIPCKVSGEIKKGDLLVSKGDGTACAIHPLEAMAGTILGKALENFDGDYGYIEVVV